MTRRRRLLAARRQHRQRGGDDRAADAEAQRVDGLGARQLHDHVDGADGGVFDVVVPGLGGQRFVRIAPADDEGAVPLRDRVADQRVVRLQVHDVELVDARRHHQHRPFIDLGAQGFVFNELEQLVLEDHCALGDGHVAAHLESGLVGLRHMPFAGIAQQVLQARGQALAFCLQRQLLRFGVQRQEIAGRRRVDPLLHRKAQPRLRLRVSFDGLGHAHQRARVQQVHLRGVGRGRVVGPFLGGETPVGNHRRRSRLGLQCLVPQRGGAFDIVALHLGQRLRRQSQTGQPLPGLAQSRHGLGAHVGQEAVGLGHGHGLLFVVLVGVWPC